MYENLPPLNSRQFYHACLKILGQAFMQKLYKISQRQLYRWAADPTFCADTEANPLDKLQVLFRRLSEIGREDIVLQALRILADTIGYEVRPGPNVTLDNSTLESECLDDYPALTNFHSAIRNREPIEKIKLLYDKAKDELDQTFAKAKEQAWK